MKPPTPFPMPAECCFCSALTPGSALSAQHTSLLSHFPGMILFSEAKQNVFRACQVDQMHRLCLTREAECCSLGSTLTKLFALDSSNGPEFITFYSSDL